MRCPGWTYNGRLDALGGGERARFVRVSDADPDMLRYLQQRGIGIGAEVELVDRQPFDGPLTLRLAAGEEIIGATLARAMRVAPAA